MNFTTSSNEVTGQNSSNLSNFSVITGLVLPIIYYIVFFVGFIGNVIVIHIMRSMFSLKKISDLYLVNLALADLVFLCTLPLWSTEYLLGRWIFGDVICKIASWFTLFSAYGSVFFLSIISVDRLIAIVLYEKLRHHRTSTKAGLTAVVAWMIAMTVSSSSLRFRAVQPITEQSTDDMRCGWNFNSTIIWQETWCAVHFLCRFLLGFIIPLCIIFMCYLSVIIYLNRRKSQKKLLRKKQDRITVTIWVVIIVFILCWMPNQISTFIYIAKGLGILEKEDDAFPDLVHRYMHLFFNCLAWSHSCVNPFLYAFMREDVKLKFIEILHHLTSSCCRGKWKDCARKDTASRLSQNRRTEELLLTCNRKSTQFPQRSQSRKTNCENGDDYQSTAKCVGSKFGSINMSKTT